MLKILDIFRKTVNKLHLAKDKVDIKVPRYPPFITGIPIVPVDDLMDVQNDILLRIRITIGVAPDIYDKYYLPVLRNFADYVQSLPASQSHHHRREGGLFRHGLETVWNAGEIYMGKIMSPESSAEARRKLEPEWRLAVFIAALCHDIGKAAYDMSVTDSKGMHRWNPKRKTLGDWATINDVDRYFIHWSRKRKHNTHNRFTLEPLLLILPDVTADFLSVEVDESMKDAMLGISTDDFNTRTIYDIVKEADKTSVEADIKRSEFTEEGESVAVPVTKHIINTMRRLLQNKDWLINKPGQRIWISSDGVFIIWKKAVSEIMDILDNDNVSGIPRNHDALADLLLESDYASPFIDSNNVQKRYWTINPILDNHTASLRLNALKLRSFETISMDGKPSYANLEIIDESVPQTEDNKVVIHNTTTDELIEKSTQNNSKNTISASDLINSVSNAEANPSPSPKTKTADKVVPAPLSTRESSVSNKAVVVERLPDLNKSIAQFIERLISESKITRTFIYQEQFTIPFPSDMPSKDSESSPSDYISQLSKLGALIPHPDSPIRFVHRVNRAQTDIGVIMFKKNISLSIQQYFIDHDVSFTSDTASSTKPVKSKPIVFTKTPNETKKKEKPTKQPPVTNENSGPNKAPVKKQEKQTKPSRQAQKKSRDEGHDKIYLDMMKQLIADNYILDKQGRRFVSYDNLKNYADSESVNRYNLMTIISKKTNTAKIISENINGEAYFLIGHLNER